MKFQIKSITGSVIFEGAFPSLGKTLGAAVKRSADLRSADLRYADLHYADLRYSDLRYADLRYADLRYADLRYADLRYADLRYADLSSIKADYFDVCLRSKNEVAGLRLALVEGRVNGSTYEGKCACLVGTIANVAGVNYKCLPRLKPDIERPSERLFLSIRKGDTPETNPISRIAVEWIDEFLFLLNA